MSSPTLKNVNESVTHMAPSAPPGGITGGMSASMDDGLSLEGGSPAQSNFEIGVFEGKIGFKINIPNNEPVVIMFTLPEIYNIVAGLENAAQHIRQEELSKYADKINQLQTILRM